MKPFSAPYGTQRVTEYFNPTQPPSYDNLSVGVNSLTASPLIKNPKGERKRPLNHSYDRTMFGPWIGELLYYTNLSGRPPDPRFLRTRTTGYLGNVGTAYVGPIWDRDYIYNLALTKLNDKVRGGLDLGLALAESGQTVRMLNVYKRYNEFIQAQTKLKKLGGAQKYGTAKLLASRWLEWQYGIRPLVSSIYDAHDEAVRVCLNEIKNFVAGHTVPLAAFSGSDTSLGFNAPYYTSVQGKQGCRFSIEYEIPSKQFDLQRWTSLNPVSFVWELTTLSFVVDWFINVSGYLRNLETALVSMARFKSGYSTELYAYKSKATMAGRSVSFNDARSGSATMLRSRIRFERKVLASYPLPRVPSFYAKLGVERLLSAASLLTTLGLPTGVQVKKGRR